MSREQLESALRAVLFSGEMADSRDSSALLLDALRRLRDELEMVAAVGYGGEIQLAADQLPRLAARASATVRFVEEMSA